MGLFDRRTAIVSSAIVAAIAAAFAVWGVSSPIAIAALVLFGCIVPSAVVLMVWRGAPPPTVAEVLHAVDRRV